MILSHNYFWPTINGKVYYDKPLGSYWLIVFCTYLTGGMSETAARLPCAFAGLLAVAFLILLGRRLYDLRTGVFGGLILATSFSFVFFSRHASADVATMTGELAVFVLFFRNQERIGGWWVIGLWLIMAVTSLMKGLLGFALPLLVIGVYSCVADGLPRLQSGTLREPLADRARWLIDRNRWFFNWYTPIALLIASAVFYAPFAISHAESGSTRGLYMVYRENIERYFKPFDHREPIYLYTYVIFALMAPWSVFLPAALVRAHYRQHIYTSPSRGDRFTLVFFWAIFIFFTLSGSRRSYYLLPILPAAALLVARLLGEPLDELNPWARRLVKIGYSVIIFAVAVSGLAFFSPRWLLPAPYALLPTAPGQIALAVCWIAAVIAVIYGVSSWRSDRIAIAVGAVAYFFLIYLFVFAMPAADAWRGEKPFAYQVRRIIANDPARLALFRNQPAVFYIGLTKSIPQYESMRDLDAAIQRGQVRWVIIRRRDLDQLNVPAQINAGEAIHPWDPEEHRLNGMILLRVEASAD
jgi:4-amino-4-deoxy-L-arabinose transferase-like glycosyltransferase